MQLVKQIRHIGYTSKDRGESLCLLRELLGISDCRTQENTYPYIAAAIGYPQVRNRVAFARLPGDPVSVEVLDYEIPRRDDPPVGLSNPGQGWISWGVENLEDSLRIIEDSMYISPLAETGCMESGPWQGKQMAFFSGKDGLFFSLVETRDSKRLSHAGFVVSNLEEILTFLTEELGFTLLEREKRSDRLIHSVTGWEADCETAVVQAAGFPLMLWQHPAPPAGPADVEPARIGNIHLCCEVEDIDSAWRTLAAHGHRFPGKPAYVTHGANRGAYAIYMQTPNELRCELYQKPEN